MQGVLIVGAAETGKDTFAGFLSRQSPYFCYHPLTSCTSWPIAEYLARQSGTTPYYQLENKKKNRDEWFRIGNKLRQEHGVDSLVRWCESNGNNVITGVRSREELAACSSRYLVVEMERCGYDIKHQDFRGLIDTTVVNNGNLEDLEYLAKSFTSVFQFSLGYTMPFPVSRFEIVRCK